MPGFFACLVGCGYFLALLASSWQPSLQGPFSHCLLCRLLCRSFLRTAFLAGAFFAAFLTANFVTSFGGFSGALFQPQPSWLRPFRLLRQSVLFFAADFFAAFLATTFFAAAFLLQLSWQPPSSLPSLLEPSWPRLSLPGLSLQLSLRETFLRPFSRPAWMRALRDDHDGFLGGSLIVVGRGENAGGFDLVVLVKVFFVIGVQFCRLRIVVAVTHRVHPEHIFHPIASSGSTAARLGYLHLRYAEILSPLAKLL